MVASHGLYTYPRRPTVRAAAAGWPPAEKAPPWGVLSTMTAPQAAMAAAAAAVTIATVTNRTGRQGAMAAALWPAGDEGDPVERVSEGG